MKKQLLLFLYLNASIVYGQINTMTFNGTSTIEAGIEFTFSEGLFENSIDGTTMGLFDNHPYATPINGGGDYKDILISENIYITTVNVSWATNVESFKLQFLNGTTIVKELSSLTNGDVAVNATANKIRFFDEGVSSSGGFELANVKWESSKGAYKTLNFDGIDDYVNLGNINTDGLAAITIEAWINHFDNGDDRIVCKSTSTSRADHIFSLAVANNIIRTRVNNNDLEFDGITTLSMNTWHHVAFVYDGSTIEIYLNGVLEASHAAPYGNLNASSQDVMIANVNATHARYFFGNIDDVRIWNKARTETEIRTNMCQSVSSSNPDLIGYWRLNSDSGTIAVDETGTNNGTLTNMTDEDWIWSGAYIGDVSAYDYTGVPATPSTYSASLAAIDGETLTATGESGTYSGIHVYRTDGAAQRTSSTIPAGWKIDVDKYWGVFAVGVTPTYSIVYDYDLNTEIANESFLGLGTRTNNNDDSWIDLGATLNQTANTLTKSTETNSEYALGVTGYVLPVELTKFSVGIYDSTPTLNWATETETNNIGFEIQRKYQESSIEYQESSIKNQDDNQSWERIGFVKGYGHSNSPKYYSFSDLNTIANSNYQYRLKQIDNDGSYSYSKIVELVQSVPFSFNLSQNYPNPFNPTTNINFSIPVVDANFTSTTNVTLKVYDILGKEVAEIVNDKLEAGNYTYEFDASLFSNGVYFYTLRTSEFSQTKKMVFLK